MSTKGEIRVPFLDLVTSHQELQGELLEVFRSCLNTAAFVGGPMVEALEQEFAAACGVSHCIGVSSGTDALRFALSAVGVRPGEAVITVANTFIATTEAITQAGAVPEFVDIDERTYNMDPAKLEEYLDECCERDPSTGQPVSRRSGRRITAIVPVHLYGQMVDMDPILELAEQYMLVVVEDACQAHGAKYYSKKRKAWKPAGSVGKAAAFSFYPGKNLGACGEAGAVTTDDEPVAQKVRMLRDHGQTAKYYHDIEGYNGRLDAIQAGILRVKLRHLSNWNRCRREHAHAYNAMLSCAYGPPLPFEPEWAHAIYHLYVIRARGRQQLRNDLNSAGIGTGIHYPVPLHLQKAYQYLGYRQGDLPICEKVTAEVLSLPMYPHLTHPQQEYVVEKLLGHLRVEDSAAQHHGRAADLKTTSVA